MNVTTEYFLTAIPVCDLIGLMISNEQRMLILLKFLFLDPTVCFNERNLRNGTYGYFICPEEGQNDDMAYCCGDEDAQRCCTYADA